MEKKEQTKRRKVFLVITFITSFIYITWRILFTIPTKYGQVSLIAGIALILAETVGFLEALEHYQNMSNGKCPERPIIPVDWYPHVDVFIATHNESTDLLYKTVNGCIHMDYPDKSKVHIYVCDDNNRPEMGQLAEKMGVGYFGLSGNRHAKAGNLNNALSKTNSPLVVTLDADMIPTHNFLMETVPYFFLPRMYKDPDGNWQIREKEDEELKIGFIQTPQSFYNPDLFQYNLFSEKRIPNEQDYFFREVNVGRNRTNSAIYAGSNTVLSRKALEDAGGIRIGSITEDFSTGMGIQSKGYTCYAINKVLAHGLSPSDVNSLIKQRERWGRGCVQTFKNDNIFFNKDLKLGTKISYLFSFIYWWTFLRRFIYILSPILFAVFYIRIVDTSLLELLAIWLPAYLFYNKALRVISSNIRNQRWSNVVDTIIFPYLIIPIFMETIGLKMNKFNVTKKDKSTIDSESNLKYALPHILLLTFSIISLFFSIRDAIIFRSAGNIIVIYWLLFNSYGLVMAILFMLGRTNLREEERYYAEVDVEILYQENRINVITCDISEAGLAVLMEYPEYIPYDGDCKLIVRNGRYRAELSGRVVHVAQLNSAYKYSFILNPLTEENKREYFQIVYDREHTLPTELHQSLSILDDLSVIVKGHTSTNRFSNRRLPRIPINRALPTKEGGLINVLDFNYEYLLIERNVSETPLDKIIVDLCNGHYISAQYDLHLSAKKLSSQSIYRVENLNDLLASPSFRNALFQSLNVGDKQVEEADLILKESFPA